jgi:TonB family protein
MAVVATAMVAAYPSAPRLLNGPDIVRDDDYPLVSANNEQEGSVRVRLGISKDGFVTSCQVVESSGHAALDEQTCALYRARAQFEPGRDGRGRAAPSTYTQKITWKLEGQSAERRPRQPWTFRTTVSFAADGKLVSCKAAATGLTVPQQDCDALTSLFKERAMTSDGARATVEGITEVYFYPMTAAKAPDTPKLKDASFLARQVSEIEIDRDGSVLSCKGTSYAGTASNEEDACKMIESERFQVAPNGEKLLVGTIIITAYTRSHTIT